VLWLRRPSHVGALLEAPRTEATEAAENTLAALMVLAVLVALVGGIEVERSGIGREYVDNSNASHRILQLRSPFSPFRA
jgi:hypothetical protein